MKFDNKDINYWFTGDSHYWHKNIVKGESSWSDKSGCRNFSDRREMSTHIVDQTNKIVMPNDVLFHVGDWSFGGIQNIWNFRNRINCKNIYLCLGNHDHHIKQNKELPNCHGKSNDGVTWNIFDGPPSYKNYDIDIKAKNLFEGVQPMYEIQIHGQRITLCHYSMRTWFFHNKGSWMLFGHSHGSLQPEGKTMDVGIDNIHDNVFGKYRPIKFQEIQKIMSKKEVSKPDHHNEKTNA